MTGVQTCALPIYGRGMLLGEFKGDDKIVVWTAKNQYYITGYDIQQHFPDDTIRVERFVADRVYAVCYYDGEQKYYYMKRFQLEASDKIQFFLEEGAPMRFVAITDKAAAMLNVEFGGQHAQRPMEVINVDEFIAVKSHRAKGKRITTYDVDKLTFIEPEVTESEEDIEDVEAIDMDELMGDDMPATTTADFSKSDDMEDGELSVSQLNLF